MTNIKVHCNYPGGNIKVLSVSNCKVELEQDLRDTSEWWFYWNFCVENAQGKDVVFDFKNGEVVGRWGPAVSKDEITWTWAGEECFLNRNSFRYSFDANDKKVFFCFSLPYQEKDFNRFYEKNKANPIINKEVLTNSEKGRPIPLLTIGNPNAEKHIVFSGRHHACESTASYLLEGLMQYLLENRESKLLKNYLFHIIPFVDIDGVEDGDQGKSRSPHDHNRDYTDKPIYQSTKAMIEYLNRKTVFLGIDFHSPYKWGGKRDDYPFVVKCMEPIKKELELFGDILEKVTKERANKNKIQYERKNDLEANEEWNDTSASTFSSFLFNKNAKLCCTFEFPYFGTPNMIYTQENCRQFGEDVAKSIEVYLMSTEQY